VPDVRSELGPLRVRPSIPTAKIDAIVATNLGPARMTGNAPPNVLYRQIAMYLCKHVGGWSTTRIGRFYNGRISRL
jgi:chromosomal replication initiation ATPase DnaA